MNYLELFSLCVCFALTASELVGPDTRKKEENDEERDTLKEREEAERIIINKAIDEERKKFDYETLRKLEAAISEELDAAVNKEILTYKEYVETLKSTQELMQGEDNNKSMFSFTVYLVLISKIKPGHISN